MIVVAPSKDIMDYLGYLFDKIEGCHKDAYSILFSDMLYRSWFLSSILTEHSDVLKGNCFGYGLLIDKCLTVYTGDTKTLAPFMSFLKTADMKQKRLYTEISAYKTEVHLFIDDHLNTLLDLHRQGIDVYLMHLDNEAVIREKIKNTALRIVETI